MEFIFTEVLVIGGGIAGMRAALAAKEKGAEVILVSKKKAGKAGSSLISNTGHRIYNKNQPEGQDLITQTLFSGQGLADENLVEVLARDSLEVVKEVQRWGSPLRFEYYHGKRSIPIYARCTERKGLLLTQTIYQKLLEKKVDIFDNYTVLQLITEEGRVVGAFATHNDQIVCFLAGAVILATGGVGRLYYPTDNPVDVSGDSVALAWGCGAELIDLEFVQFYPYQLKSPKSMDIHTSVFKLGAKLTNQHGDYFMAEYPEQELVTRDILSREMFLQEGEITLDLMDIDLDELSQINPQLLKFYLADEELTVSPIQHFFMGGVKIDANARSSVPGLYVCGEASGGLHGANRLGGNALSECLVFGRIAGWNAACEVHRERLELTKLARERVQNQLWIPQKGFEHYLLTQTRLSHLMWEGVGIVRDGESLQKVLHEIEADLLNHEKSNPRSITEWYQMRNRLITARLITEAAICREESRGAHYRLDFPETDPAWEGHICITGDKKYLLKKIRTD